MSRRGTGTGVLRRGLVIDVETRIDRNALRASGRSSAPRGMPPGLQVIVAGAMLAFEMDGDGACTALSLRSAYCAGGGERTLLRLMDRELARLHRDGGVLVSFNGGHDLSMIRLGLLRHGEFAGSGAASWRAAPPDMHQDLMLQLAGDASTRWASLADLSAALGVHAPGEVVVGPAAVPAELAKCETDVVATMAVYLHLLAERAGSDAPVRGGVGALSEMIAARLDRSPHLAAVQGGRLFRHFQDD